jgi:Na+/H+ antiporter NhaD/arsenite permease-like protein
MELIAALIFILGYLGIAIEHKIHMSKSAIALAMGGALWLIASASGIPGVREAIGHSGAEIFEIVVFLLAAMSLVEILVHYRFFDIVRGKLYALGLANRNQLALIAVVTFFLSAVLDNLTTTIVMIQIARQFFKDRNLLIAAATIVIAANAGGAWSPIGDVTTIMLWIADKFNAAEIITQGFLPSLAIAGVATALLIPKINNDRSEDDTTDIVTKLSKSEIMIIILTFLSFTLPVVMNTVFDLPPYLGLLIGFGIVWAAVDFFKHRTTRPTHLEANIEQLIQKTDLASIKFFIGILLAVSALHQLGVLEVLSNVLYGHDPVASQIIVGNVGLGVISAILDNVPLAAIAISVLHTEVTAFWVLLAVALGTGGSLLVIGSAAGVVAMGMVKELNFGQYLQIATIPALLGFVAGMAVWAAQYFLFIA